VNAKVLPILTVPERLARLEERSESHEETLKEVKEWQKRATYGLIAILMAVIANLLGLHR
jgi:hypothetical protein